MSVTTKTYENGTLKNFTKFWRILSPENFALWNNAKGPIRRCSLNSTISIACWECALWSVDWGTFLAALQRWTVDKRTGRKIVLGRQRLSKYYTCLLRRTSKEPLSLPCWTGCLQAHSKQCTRIAPTTIEKVSTNCISLWWSFKSSVCRT